MYNTQIYLCASLLEKAKKKYYTDLKASVINNNKKVLGRLLYYDVKHENLLVELMVY